MFCLDFLSQSFGSFSSFLFQILSSLICLQCPESIIWIIFWTRLFILLTDVYWLINITLLANLRNNLIKDIETQRKTGLIHWQIHIYKTIKIDRYKITNEHINILLSDQCLHFSNKSQFYFYTTLIHFSNMEHFVRWNLLYFSVCFKSS